MGGARFIVCEKSGRWAAGLRRVLAPSGIRVYETRSLGECWEELAAHPVSFLALEARPASSRTGSLTVGGDQLASGPEPYRDEKRRSAPSQASEVAKRLLELRTGFPHARAVVLAAGGSDACRWVFREAGAVHVVCSLSELTFVGRLAVRFLEAASADDDRDPLRALEERLPWREAGQ